jgi:NTE family protein
MVLRRNFVNNLGKLMLVVFLTQGVLCADGLPDTTGGQKHRKVGVALAGGAALGLAHIGVLEWLEEHRIPIDYIAGTSMGALVGGLYASGLTTAEIREFARQVDWQQTFSPVPPYRQLAFRRKEDAAAFPVAFEMGLKGGRAALPSGLSAGQGVGLVLARFAAPYGHMNSFDDLPTPFRCVASDLRGGKGVVFDKGSLFDALRATMSLPAFFAPVQTDGMVLVDGALTNNLPVDVVKAMGADYTIAVALDLPSNPADFQSLLGVAGKSISYMIAEKERAQMAAADVVVMPVLKGLTAADYTRWDEFRKIGYEAAERKAEMFRQFQVSEDQYRAYLETRRARRLPVSWRPRELRVSGDISPKLKKALIDSVRPAADTDVDVSKLEEEMLKITGTGEFDTASYELLREGDQEILHIRVSERANGLPFLKPGIFIDGASGEGMQFGMGGRVTFLGFGGPASEWRTDAAVGTYNVLSSEYYYRIQGSKWFVAPRAGFSKTELPLYDSQGHNTADFDTINYNVGGDFGYAFGRYREFRAGYEFGYLKTTLDTGSQTPMPLSGQYAMTRAIFRRDTRNGPLVPTHGSFLDVRAAWFNKYPGVSRGFATYEGVLQRALALNPRYSVAVLAAGGSTVNENSLGNFFDLGGVFRVSALSRGQLRGNNYYLGSVQVRRAFSVEALSMFAKFYGVVGYELGRAWPPGQRRTPRQDGLIGIMGATRIGLVFFGASVGDQGAGRVLFRLGRAF